MFHVGLHCAIDNWCPPLTVLSSVTNDAFLASTKQYRRWGNPAARDAPVRETSPLCVFLSCALESLPETMAVVRRIRRCLDGGPSVGQAVNLRSTASARVTIIAKVVPKS